MAAEREIKTPARATAQVAIQKPGGAAGRPPSEPARIDRLRKMTPDMIESTYRKGYITAAQRNDIMREKARLNVADLLEEQGFGQAVITRTVQHIQDGWDNLKEAALRDPTGERPQEALYFVGLAMWGQVQILTSIFNAFGEVSGQRAENIALAAGASPGLARVINISVDIGTGFIPIGIAVKSGVTGIRAIKAGTKGAKAVAAFKAQQKALQGSISAIRRVARNMAGESPDVSRALLREADTIARKGVAENLSDEAIEQIQKVAADLLEAQALPTATRAAELSARGAAATRGIQKVAKEQAERLETTAAEQAEVLASKALADGLRIDGVADAPKIVSEAAEAAGRALPGPAEARIIKEGLEAVAREAPGTVREKFFADLKKFKAEMKAITEPQARAEVSRLAERLGLTLDDLKNVVPGQALDEKQMLAYLRALEPQVNRMAELADNVVDNLTNPQVAQWVKDDAIRQLAEHTGEFLTVAPIFRGAQVTAGRSVEILKTDPPIKKITQMMEAWDPDAMARGDWQGAMETFAEDVVAMFAESPEKVEALAVVSQGLWARFQEKGFVMMREAYMNLLLARPITQVRNFLGNTVAAVNSVLERFTGAAFSADRKAGLVGKEGIYLIKGMYHAMADGLWAFTRAYKKIDADEIGRFDYVPHQIPGLLGRLINIPGDSVRGMDNFFKVILRRASYYAQALREGSQSGRTGKILEDFVARRVNAPTLAMRNEANHFTLVNTFQNELGKMGNLARKSMQAGPMVAYFPFMKTPINLAKYAWNRTPGLQLISTTLYDDILAGGVKADLAIGRLTFSNFIAMFLMELAQEGMITGSGPVDPDLRKTWLATHEPYSVRTEDGWRPIKNTEPGSTMLGLVADYAQIMNQLDDPSAEQGAMAIVFAGLRNIADKTYFKTLGDLLDLSAKLRTGEEPGQKAKQILTGPLTTVLTGGPIVAGAVRGGIPGLIEADPVLRETRTFMDGLLARIPGYSKDLAAKRDGYGRKILPPQSVGAPWLGIASPATFRPEEEGRIQKEGSRIQAKLPIFPFNIGGRMRDDFDIRAPLPEDKLPVELTAKQRERWQIIYKNLLEHPELGMEKQVLDNPAVEYFKQPQALQRELFSGYLTSIKSAAKDALLIEDLDLQKKVLEADAAALMPLLQQQQQRNLQLQLQDTKGLLDDLAPEQRRNLMRWGILDQEEAPE